MRRKKTTVVIIVFALLSYFGAHTSLGQRVMASNKPPSVSYGKAKCISLNEAANAVYCVVHVVDGDTLDLDMGGKTVRVRLLGINTPETVDPRRPVQCFGKEASNHAKETLTGKWVTVEADPSQDKYDKYGRMLLYIYTPDKVLFNLMMIEDGYAYEYTYRFPYKYQQQFKSAERIARTEQRGLWAKDSCAGRK